MVVPGVVMRFLMSATERPVSSVSRQRSYDVEYISLISMGVSSKSPAYRGESTICATEVPSLCHNRRAYGPVYARVVRVRSAVTLAKRSTTAERRRTKLKGR